MIILHNYLRMYRKRSQLTQNDVAFLLKLSDYSNVSRYEQGLRKPEIENLLAYHLLFDIPIESLFERQKHELKDTIRKRVEERLKELKTQPSDAKLRARITFLDSTLSRLNALAASRV